MPKAPSILIFGHELALLRSRAWLLEREGYAVQTTTELEEAIRLTTIEQVDVMILCHTLGDQECASILAVAHVQRPEMKNLLLVPYSSREAVNDTVLHGFVDAKALLQAIQGLIQPCPTIELSQQLDSYRLLVNRPRSFVR